jgi:hypothetical protein
MVSELYLTNAASKLPEMGRKTSIAHKNLLTLLRVSRVVALASGGLSIRQQQNCLAPS